jgi:phenylacetate-coenzyme A ligase PaaK-like adenylate-forming protein
LAERARQCGLALPGATIFTGGEPLTETRRRFIESVGWHAVPRYAAAEVGLLGAGCAERTTSDDIHLYRDLVAVIARTPARENDAVPLLVTTMSLHTGKVLLNTHLGDTARLNVRPCSCLFGKLGLTQRAMEVRSDQRLTVEGMTVPIATLDALLGRLVEESGGAPDSHQFRKQIDGGLERLVVALSPDLGPLDEERFLDALYDRMLRGGSGLDLAAHLWKQARTIRIVREHPRQSPRQNSPR